MLSQTIWWTLFTKNRLWHTYLYQKENVIVKWHKNKIIISGKHTHGFLSGTKRESLLFVGAKVERAYLCWCPTFRPAANTERYTGSYIQGDARHGGDTSSCDTKLEAWMDRSQKGSYSYECELSLKCDQ